MFFHLKQADINTYKGGCIMKKQNQKEKNSNKKKFQVLDKGIDLKNGTRDIICCKRVFVPVLP